MLKHLVFKSVFIVVLMSIFSTNALAQCPQLIDGQGNASANPVWTHCTGGTFTLFLQTNQAVGAYTVNWGDGNSSAGAALVPPATISHTYAAGTANYTLTFTSGACTITGLVVLERQVNAAINRPLGGGGVTRVCAPGALQFINSSTDVSPNTTFRWDFGDGSPVQTFNSTNAGDTMSHTYQRNTVNCNTQVRLTAENYCTTVPSVVTISPIEIYDLDDAAIQASNTLLCYPDTVVTFINSSNLNCRAQGNTAQRFEHWNFGDYWGKGYDSIIGWIPFANPPSQPFAIAYPGKGTYNVTLQDSNFCGVDAVTIQVTIGDPPVANFTTDKDTICEGDNIRFINQSTGGADQSIWNYADGTGAHVRGMGNQNRQFNTSGSYAVSLQVSNTNGSAACVDDTVKDVYVKPGPTADFTLTPAQGCDSLDVQFTDNSIAAAQWQWDFDNGNTFTGANPSTIHYDTMGQYTPKLVVTRANGCVDSITSTVQIYSSPVVAFTPNNVCEGYVAQFTDQSTVPGGDPLLTWNWDFGDGGSSTVQHPTHTYGSSGNFQLKLTTATNFCSKTDSFQMVVEPKPTADFSLSDSVGCAPLTIQFTNNSLVSTLYEWDFGDGDTSSATSPSHVFQNNTNGNVNYTIRLISKTAFGCSDTLQRTITVFPKPTAAFTSTAVPKCGPSDVTFTNTSVNADTLLWDFGDGDTSTASNPSHTYQNKTLFITNYDAALYVTSANGCRDTANQQIVVYPEPIFTFSSVPDSGCSPLTVNFPSLTGAVQYQWDFGDGSTGSGPSPSHVYINPTTNRQQYNVQLIATSSFGCSDTNFATVVVFPNPAASFTVNQSTGCQPLDISFTNNSTGAVNYFWDFDFGDTLDTNASLFARSFTHQLPFSQVRNVTLQAITADGCRDTAQNILTVYPDVQADFECSDTALCSPGTLNFLNKTLGATAYRWSFGNGQQSIQTSPSNIQFSNATLTDAVYSVELVAYNQFNCTDTVRKSVRVYPKPRAAITANKASVCEPDTVSFTNGSQLNVTNFWSFGDGATDSSNATLLKHEFQNKGSLPVTRTVQLFVESAKGCKDTATTNVVVNPEIVADFTGGPLSGCHTLRSDFFDNSKGAAQYAWSFGDGQLDTKPNPVHFFTNTGIVDSTYTVRLIAGSQYGCFDTISKTVTVYPQPIADFSITPNRQKFPQSTVSIVNNSNAGSWNYHWTLSDSASDTATAPGTYTYPTWGTYKVTLEVSSANCNDTLSKTIIIDPPRAIPKFFVKEEGCSPLAVQIIDSSLYGVSYLWNYGDGNTSSSPQPLPYTYFQTGTYDVSLTLTGPDGVVTTVTEKAAVKVHDRAEAYFDVRPNEVVLPTQEAEMFNFSNFATDWLWDFGDSATSTEENPAHHYEAAGTYTVTLIANNENNCPDTFALIDIVTAKDGGAIEFPTAFIPDPSGGNGGYYDPGSISNTIFFPKFEGVIDYHLSIYNRWGEMVFETTDIRQGWDGYYKGTGKLCQQDVYIWKASGTFANERGFNEAGEVTLLR